MVNIGRSSVSLIKSSLISGFLLLAAACSTDAHRALFPLELQVDPVAAKSWAEQNEALERLLKADPELRKYVADMVEAVQAELSEERQQWNAAANHWLAALKLDRGAVGKLSFQRWIAVQAQLDPAHSENSEALARILLAATKDGEESPFLKKQSLTDKAALSKKIQSLIVLAPQPILGPPAAAVLPAPNSFAGSDDLYWELRAKALCKKNLDAKWISWVSSLSEAQRIYWDALLANCDGESAKAAGLFKQSLSGLSSRPQDKARAVRSAELLIQNLKAIGDRAAATEAYQSQSLLLKRNDLPLDLLKWSAFEKQKRFIESVYWVGRNRAMQGDYERAKIAAHEGLDTINILQNLSRGSKEQAVVTALKADGLNILASRIAYEQLDFATALSLNKVALETPNLSVEWRQRLLWAEGWYDYRKGDKELAIKAWNVFLSEKLEDSLRTKALFWTGRAYWELNRKASAETAFAELQKIAPLSFYSVVGIPAIDPDVKWSETFKGAKPSKLSKFDDFDWGAYRDDAEALKRFHRLEIALGAKLKTLYSGLGQELFDQINGKPKLLADVEPSLYASRLLNMAQQYILAISLSSQINQSQPGLWEEYPEQLLVFFPRPYPAEVARASSENFLEPELIWGLSRQESSFRSTVESPVGAIGLMQLMPATAQDMARSKGINPSGMAERLKEADLNIQLGSFYLAKLGKRYKNKWPCAIAAYNAGEYVVDTWIARRDASDLIIWAEGLSFGETSSYVKNVWRNWEVYNWLSKQG